jgi:mycothiol synthase
MTPSVLPAELLLRRPTVDDVVAVSDLQNACSLAATGVPTTTPESLRQSWTFPGFHLATDAWVIATPAGQIVGYVDLWRPDPQHSRVYSDGYVYPEYRERGIGTALVRTAEGRANDLATQAQTPLTFVTGTVSTNQAGRSLLEHEGFALIHHFWQMVIDLTTEPAAPRLPHGITIRASIAGQDERTIWEAAEEAFQDHYDHTTMPFDAWLKWRTSNPARYDPALWFIAEEDGQVAGTAICEPSSVEDPNMGWVGTLGVRRTWRKRGVGMALLQHSFRALYLRGRRKVGLGVDAASLTGATRLYERAGMRVNLQFDQYAKEVRPDSEAQ